ncbi:hypothetical protein [Flindersiella endophytica]
MNEINQAHGVRFVLRERCQDGFGGAWLLSDSGDRRAVLKLNTDVAHRIGHLPQLIDRIRAAGYPTPRWLAAGETVDGTAYHVVDFVSGEPMSRSPLTLRLVENLIEVIERQAGLDPDRTVDWAGYVWECAFGNGENDRELPSRGALPHPSVNTILRPPQEAWDVHRQRLGRNPPRSVGRPLRPALDLGLELR